MGLHLMRFHIQIWLMALCWLSISAQSQGATRVFAWGAGKTATNDFYNYGQSIVPTNLTDAVLVAGGWRHSMALRPDGTLLGWGNDTLGQLDYPTDTNHTYYYISVSCGYLHSIGLLSNGVVKAWGDNFYGQTIVPPNLSGVVAVSCGFYHNLVLKPNGTVVAWGTSTNSSDLGTDPNYGQTLVPANLSNVVAISAGGWHSLALKSDGTVRAWGRDDALQADTPSGLSNVVAIAAGAAFSMVLKDNGTIIAWGANEYTQTNVPAAASNVVAIAAGGWHGLALRNDGTVVAWGAGTPQVSTNLAYGQSTVPGNLTNVVQIAGGLAHSLALTNSGPPILKAMLTSLAYDTNGFSCVCPGRNGRVYALEYKNSLTDTAWTSLPLKAGTNGTIVLTDPGPASPERFYRVRQW
jgi:alpha-tubulin suppressor-like RCC1 family protein